MRLHRQIVFAAAGLALIAGGAVRAQENGWGAGYQMGQSYAGVANAENARMTFSCAGRNARVGAGRSGPSLTVALPKAQAKQDVARSIEIVIDGKATRVPVKTQRDLDTLELVWTPDSGFGIVGMKPVVAALRQAKTIEVRAGGATLAFPTQKASEALKEDPLACD